MFANKAVARLSARSFVRTTATFQKFLAEQLEGFKQAGTYKKERIITSPQSAVITTTAFDKPVLNFCANNYLGLADNPRLIAAAKKTLDQRGLGLSSVRFICGTQDIHKTLEKKIAQFHGTEDAILYASCFDANGGIYEALFDERDMILTDELNHASIIDGMKCAKKVPKKVYKHMDMADLERLLNTAEAKKARFRVLVTDGVFSMDGDVAPLKEICDLADKYNCLTFTDECHATGFFGKTGRGAPEYCGVEGRMTFINGTLGKALGGASGGYTASTKEVVDMLRQRSRPYLFSNTLCPGIVGASIEVIDMLTTSTELQERSAANTARFRTKMAAAGFKLAGSKDHPICPVMLGDARLALAFADDMLKRGIYVIGFCFPVVPKGKARIRVQISAAHTFEQIDQAVAAFTEVGKLRKVI